uniref:NADH-ubiquinone oxidoreductase chain 4 n=1 Tax=Rhigonema thysanophora TaxID=435730 RepID=X2CTU6_9BILA|nr:NADH dehydrogenase subunit 4 [Rhigonema thysanophora]AGZ90411.1 NADH dehydrogenase subunit 4 [Rhigonema thysanophora]
MISLFLLSFFFVNCSWLFLFLGSIFSVVMFFDYSWSGLFFVLDSFSYVLLVMLSFVVLGVVLLSEKSEVLSILSIVLVVFCIFFFVPGGMIMFYMFFELSMIPILIMILGYGSQVEKVNSAYYLIFYAAFCSLPFLFIYFKNFYYFNIVYFDVFLSWEAMLVLTLSFMMKFPVYFLHLWLPKAHVEAPTTASMLLAALLLKLGTVGFVRVVSSFGYLGVNFWLVLSFLGMVLASISCSFQSDGKALAAYSSIAHMSFVLMSLVFLVLGSKTSGVIMMLSHGYTSALMFYLIGEFFHSSFSRMVYYMSGFFSSLMLMSLIFSFVFMSNMGVPPSMSFMSEYMSIAVVLNLFKMGMTFVGVYFLFAFYYSIYLLTSSLMGKNFVKFNSWGVASSTPLVLMMYNFFWFGILF